MPFYQIRLQHICDGTLIDEASRVVMRSNNPCMAPTSLNACEVAPRDGARQGHSHTQPTAVILSVEWSKTLHEVLNVYIAVFIRGLLSSGIAQTGKVVQYCLVSWKLETKYFEVKGVSLVSVVDDSAGLR